MGWIDVLTIALLVAANGFFVAAEFALVKVRISQIDQLVEQGHWAAKLTSRALDRLDAYLSASQLGITVASLALGQQIEHAIKPGVDLGLSALGFGKGHSPMVAGLAIGSAIALAIGTFLHMALGEQAPKSLAIRYAKHIALATAPVLVAFYYVFWPIIWLLNSASNLTLVLLGLGHSDHAELVHTEEELRHILGESAAGGFLSRNERRMIENVLNLEEKTARRVMVPRPDIVYLSLGRPLEDNLRLARQAGHTRYPLCEDDLQTVVGMIHVKDLFRAAAAPQARPDLRKVSRPVPTLPDTLHLDKLLLEFQRQRVHLAMLADERGALVGMVTLENVLEEVVGPIQDEFDRELPRITDLGEGVFEVDAACPIDELAETCGVEVPETEAETAAGLVLDRLGRLARVGDRVEVGEHWLTVLQADPTRIRRIRVEPAAPDGPQVEVNGEGHPAG